MPILYHIFGVYVYFFDIIYISAIKKEKSYTRLPLSHLAERTGFEPAVLLGTPAFQASTLDHSDTSPCSKYHYMMYGHCHYLPVQA